MCSCRHYKSLECVKACNVYGDPNVCSCRYSKSSVWVRSRPHCALQIWNVLKYDKVYQRIYWTNSTGKDCSEFFFRLPNALRASQMLSQSAFCQQLIFITLIMLCMFLTFLCDEKRTGSEIEGRNCTVRASWFALFNKYCLGGMVGAQGEWETRSTFWFGDVTTETTL